MVHNIFRLIGICLIVFSVYACHPKSYVVLLNNLDGTTGAIALTDIRGTTTLSQARYGLNLDTNKKAEAFEVSEERIQQDFGKALEVQPESPVTFTLYFELGTTKMTPESQYKISEIVSTIRSSEIPKVEIIGHADRSGVEVENFWLGFNRAVSVKTLLIDMGVPSDVIVEIKSHGEYDPAVPTGDGVREPLNRRVQVIIL